MRKRKSNSNRTLARTFKYLNRLNFCQHKEGYFKHISALKQIPYEIYDLEPVDNNYVYRAVMNQPNIHFTNISRIAFNPSPNCISRANLSKQPIAYYACAYDIALIEACHDKLRQSNERSFLLTVSKWKVVKKVPVQIICNCPQTQKVGTDLYYFYDKCRLKRKSTLPAKKYRTWFLKTRFISEQFAKEANDNMNYYITARYSNQISFRLLFINAQKPSEALRLKFFLVLFLSRKRTEIGPRLLRVAHDLRSQRLQGGDRKSVV